MIIIVMTKMKMMMTMTMAAMKGVGLKRRDATILWSENLSNLTIKDASFCFVLIDNDDHHDDNGDDFDYMGDDYDDHDDDDITLN